MNAEGGKMRKLTKNESQNPNDYVRRSELILHLSDWAFSEAPLKDDHDQNIKYDTIQTCIEAVEQMPSANVVELELSPVCYNCDGKTAEGFRTDKCLWINGDNSKCIEQANKLLDVVKVVRCKDCKHNAQRYVKGAPEGGKDFAQCELDALVRDNEFWCARGETEDE